MTKKKSLGLILQTKVLLEMNYMKKLKDRAILIIHRSHGNGKIPPQVCKKYR